MKFTLGWLKDHLDTSSDLETIANILTNIGLEIESLEDPSEIYKDFTVAKVLRAEPHPDADRLKVCEVKTINGIFQVVCGAPNARSGMLGIFAPENSFIPGISLHLKRSKIRGVESYGMLVSEREMGLSDNHESIIEVDSSLKIGEKFSQLFNLDDPIIEVNITPNRPDCLSVRGIARDLAAAGLGKLKQLKVTKIPGNYKSPKQWKKDFSKNDSHICPGVAGRYFKNVKNCESPQWLQLRLKAIGLRPISALVDITNYITNDLGRPLHVYDGDKLNGDLTMRLAKENEKCLTLDEIEYKCSADMVVISDDIKLHGIGGVMGGLDSGCNLDTKNVFLEVALFDPISITKTGRKLNIQSDARYRFERGIDSESINWGVDVASKMILDICGGECSDIVSTEIHKIDQKIIQFNIEKVKSIGGIDIPINDQVKILSDLEFTVKKINELKLEVMVPTFRPDIDGEYDLVEEIIRIYGFENIPVQEISQISSQKEILNSGLKSFYRAKRLIANKGYLETVTWSFMDEKIANYISKDTIKIENPISSDLGVMRPSAYPNLLQAINANKARMYFRGKIFEVGPNFDNLIENKQINVATAIGYGLVNEENWSSTKRNINVYDIKGDLFSILIALNIPIDNLNYEEIQNNIYHPGKSSSLRLGKNLIANYGELHPILLNNLEIKIKVFGFEIFLDNLSQFQIKKTSTKSFFDNNLFQMVERDFSFLFPKFAKVNDITNKIKQINKKIIKKITIFDVYEGEKLPKDKKSIALRVLLQPQEKTFTDEEIENISNQIIDLVTNGFEATLRQ